MQPKANILLVEDDESLAFMLQDALQDEGYAIVQMDNQPLTHLTNISSTYACSTLCCRIKTATL